MDHVAGELEGAAQKHGRTFHPALEHEFADLGRRAHQPLDHDRRHHADSDIQARAFAAEQGGVAFPAGPKSEIPAHHHVAGVEVFGQHFGDEAIGGQSSKVGCERLDHDRISAGLGKQFQATIERQQHRRRQLGREESRGMGIEGQNGGLTAFRVGQTTGYGQQGPVATVHTVEVSDGHRRRAQRTPQDGRDALAAPNDVHPLGDKRPGR